ncbi:DUF417 family protein [Pseudomonas moraviensis]|uniref:DUF417 family protein n=1 Tax=Pseudomonas moraviensis TaxID=321662 RepID=UPI002852EAB0|nr:DUF417 family protein [Pseudomonas moraviensis]
MPYEADSITPFVANSPVMSFFYEHPQDYKAHLTHEGELNADKRAWQAANNTYGFFHRARRGGKSSSVCWSCPIRFPDVPACSAALWHSLRRW